MHKSIQLNFKLFNIIQLNLQWCTKDNNSVFPPEKTIKQKMVYLMMLAEMSVFNIKV